MGDCHIVSVDIGYLHLAFVSVVVVYVENKWVIDRILQMIHINISIFTCQADCPLHHTKSVTDYLTHVIHQYPCFDACDILLVERQPIHGLVVCQEFFLHQYRNKVILVHPRSVQKHYMIHQFEGGPEERREQRKQWVTKRALLWLGKYYETTIKGPRKHDVADAWVQLVYFLTKENKRMNPTQSKYFLLPFL